jgi:hypothetical protein
MPRETLEKFTGGGVSVLVGTVGADLVPTCCRGIAIRMHEDFETVTVYVPTATAAETIANAEVRRRVAISCTHPLSHESMQIKGLTRDVRLAPASDEAFVRQRLEQFGDVLVEFGLPRHVTLSIAHWPAWAIDVSVEQVFDQTPGPKAGAAVA